MSASTFRVARPVPSSSLITNDAPEPTRPGVFRYPSLTTTVPKEFVHRASVAEVLLTDWERTDESRLSMTAQWPRGHSFFTAVDGYHDPLIAAETIRQAGLLLAHAEFGVPLGHHFLMWDLHVDVCPEQLLMGSAPASLHLDITCSDIKWRGSSLTGLHYEVVIRRHGRPVAAGGASFTCTSPAVYRRVRANRTLDGDCPQLLALTAPVAPQSVGRMSPRDVVLTPVGEDNRWQLRVDTRHPVLFDHPVDHVPGMVLIEAARQATAAALDRPALPLGIASTFGRYAELDTPCVIEARRLPGDSSDGGDCVLVTGHQMDEPVFRSVVTVASTAV
ncbi:ScbA/BarX family gamma-butyrolactone biosynthesis protein [Streptomyces acidicola]|uniref:A-factor biosynthesis hotdog domain-containing protein n=1 Tax=Streptomyces acidicola TaxID=2596892 RepID=A0A5N8WT10_9ACTN|nr:ScbA/BarX family gamma-butyrolactone biosynthesis protein [Streptomyces acidicola]MPY49956.1 hypothetical protein [Streptomyces acidicola]